MINSSAKIKIMELVNDDLTNGSLGTSTQAPALTDTALIAEVTSTIATLTVSQNNQQIITTYNLNSTTGNGNTYAEYANYFTTSDTMFNRITFTGVPKNSAIEFQVSSIINIL